jgi:hypothetical protein
VKENLKPYVYNLWKHVKVQPRTFCRTVRRVTLTGEVKVIKTEAEGKPSVNSACILDTESVRVDPKPGDLSMSRLKLP